MSQRRQWNKMTESSVTTDELLVQAALRVRAFAYAPYSNFQVGCAVVGGSGQVFVGANVENASYGLTMCAERVAIFGAVAAGERSIVALAVVTGSESVTPPCGACRQVIVELGPDARILGANLQGDRQIWTAGSLLPDAFGPRSLRDSSRAPEAKG